MANRTTIGDFRSAPNNQPRKVEEAPEPVKQPDTVEPAAVKTETTTPDEAPPQLTPGEAYIERLKDAEMTLRDAMIIYDAVLEKGYFEEYIRIRGDNRAVFRTRTYEDTLRLQTALEIHKPQLVINQQGLISRYNLAASLYEWKGKPIRHETEKDFDDTLAMMRRMPEPVIHLLTNALSKFDGKVAIVFSEGASENF